MQMKRIEINSSRMTIIFSMQSWKIKPPADSAAACRPNQSLVGQNAHEPRAGHPSKRPARPRSSPIAIAAHVATGGGEACGHKEDSPTEDTKSEQLN